MPRPASAGRSARRWPRRLRWRRDGWRRGSVAVQNAPAAPAHQRRAPGPRRRRDDLLVVRQRDQRCPDGDAAGEVLRPVDRIDDPADRAAPPSSSPKKPSSRSATRARNALDRAVGSVTGVRSGFDPPEIAAPNAGGSGRRSAVAVIGAALDLGAGRRGVDMGPSAIRYAGLDARIEELGRASSTWQRRRRAVPRRSPSGDERARYLDEILAPASRSPTASRRRRSAASCRSSSAATTRSRSGRSAVSRAQPGPGGVLWIDAHGDLNRPETSPTGNVHGMALAAAMGLAGPAFEDRRLAAARGRPEPGRPGRRPLARRRGASAAAVS